MSNVICPMKLNNSAAFEHGIPGTFDCDPKCAWLIAVKNSPTSPVEAYVCSFAAFVANSNTDKYIQNFVKGGE